MALEKAEVLLSLKHGIVRLDNVWGVGGGIRPVKTLMKKVWKWSCDVDVFHYNSCFSIAQIYRLLIHRDKDLHKDLRKFVYS